MVDWVKGLSLAQLEEAQARYAVCFPPDMIEMYQDRWPAQAYDWSIEDSRIRDVLAWPLELLLADVEHGSWWPAWGECPREPAERAELVRQAVANAPRLLPIFSHRFLPEKPSTAGNPVFSMYGLDTIFYGANLAEYFENEFSGSDKLCGVPREQLTPEGVANIHYIPFWSDLALGLTRSVEIED